MQPGSPRFPCSHPMHASGCRFPVNELAITGTESPAAHHERDIHRRVWHIAINTDAAWHGWITCVSNRCTCIGPQKHPLDFVSCSDFPVCTNRLYQPAFGFCPAVLADFFEAGSSRTEISCRAVGCMHEAMQHGEPTVVYMHALTHECDRRDVCRCHACEHRSCKIG